MKTIRILGNDFKVMPTSNAIRRKKGSVSKWSLGASNTIDDRTIWINKDMHPEEKTTTLIHECLHSISFISNLRLSERQVRGLEVGLFAILKDNKVDITPLRKIANSV